jgi:hypothetical protein
MRYLSSIPLALVVLMALACTTTPAPTPLPTPDVPFLDEETVEGLVLSYITGQNHLCATGYAAAVRKGESLTITKEYLGNDIWVVKMLVQMCTFTVHDKEAHVILPQQDKTAD